MISFGRGYGALKENTYKERQANSNKYECYAAKRECRQLYNYKCQICGGEGIDAHHINGDETDNRQDNLICLCRGCHERTHLGIYIIDTEKHITFNGDLYEFMDYNTAKPLYKEYMDRNDCRLMWSKTDENKHLRALDNKTKNIYIPRFNKLRRELKKVDEEAKTLKKLRCEKRKKIKIMVDYFKPLDRDIWHTWMAIYNNPDSISDSDLEKVLEINKKHNN